MCVNGMGMEACAYTFISASFLFLMQMQMKDYFSFFHESIILFMIVIFFAIILVVKV